METGTRTAGTRTRHRRSPHRIRRIVAAAALFAALPLSSVLHGGAARAADLLTLPSRGNVTESVYVDAASANPPWIVVLFAGDDGALNLNGNGARRLRGNFLVRTAPYWTRAGDASALFDAPSDASDGMSDAFRLSEAALQDAAATVAELRRRYPSAKIALLGTSRGTITVGNLLKRAPTLADAYVLTSPVTIARGAQTGLAGLRWDGVSARVLVLSNEHDGCAVSPFDAAKRLADDNRFTFVAVSSTQGGGTPHTACNAQSPHGFLGIEPQVLDTIRGWLDGKAIGAN